MFCLDKNNPNVKNWVDAIGEDATWNKYMTYNGYLPDFKKYSEYNPSILDIQQIRKYVSDIFPIDQFSFEELSKIKNIVSLEAEGAFWKDTLYFSSSATELTALEESFHGIFQRLTSSEEREELYKAIQEILNKKHKNLDKYLKDKYPNKTKEYALEEELAKEFINYKLFRDNNLTDKINSFSDAIKKFFDFLYRFFTNTQSNSEKIESYYNKIIRGNFREGNKKETFSHLYPSLRIIYNNDSVPIKSKDRDEMYSNIISIYRNPSVKDLDLAISIYSNYLENKFPSKYEKISELFTPLIEDDFEGTSFESEKYNEIKSDLQSIIDRNPILEEDLDIDTLSENVGSVNEVIENSSDKDNEKSPLERLSKRVKDYIQTIGEIVDFVEYDGVDIPIYTNININNVYSALVRNLSNTPNELDKLKKLSYVLEDRKAKDSKLFVKQLFQDLFFTKEELKELSKKFKQSKELYDSYRDSLLVRYSDEIRNATLLKDLSISNPEKALYLLKSFDLYTRDIILQTVDTKNQLINSFDPFLADIINPQLDEWETTFITKPIKGAVLKATLEDSVEDIDNALMQYGINLSDNFIKYSKGKYYKEKGIENEFTIFSDQYNIDNYLKEDDLKFILNSKSNIYDENKGALTRLRGLAEGNANFDESILESSYQDPENKTIYGHQNKTFDLNLKDFIKRSPNPFKEIGDEEVERTLNKFRVNNFAKLLSDIGGLDKLRMFTYGGFRQEDRDDEGNRIENRFATNSSFKNLDPKSFNASKLNLVSTKAREIIVDSFDNQVGEKIYVTRKIVPLFVGHHETSNTAEFQEVEWLHGKWEQSNGEWVYKKLIDNDQVTDYGAKFLAGFVNQEIQRSQEFLSFLRSKGLAAGEYNLNAEFLRKLGMKKIIDGYHTGGKINISYLEDSIKITGKLPRILQPSVELNGFLPENYKEYFNTQGKVNTKDLIQDVKKTYNETLNKEVEEFLKNTNAKEIDGAWSTIKDNDNLKRYTEQSKRQKETLGLSDNLQRNVKIFLINNTINSIGLSRYIYGDFLVFNKNDMQDLHKRNKGRNASIISARTELVSPKLGITSPFTSFSAITHEEVKGISSINGESEIDSMDAQSFVSVEHTRYLLWGLGRLDEKTSELLTKVQNGEEFTQQDREWMHNNDTFLSANKTISFTTLSQRKMAESYTETISKLNTSIAVRVENIEEINLPETEVSGVQRSKIGATREITYRIENGEKIFYEWLPINARKSLYDKRKILEGWRLEDGKWIYKGKKIGMITPKSASKRMQLNTVPIKDNEPDWKNIDEYVNEVDTEQYGLQVENQGIKDNIIDPSQNLEIITNELGDVNVTDPVTGKSFKLSGKEFTNKFQGLLAQRDSTTFNKAVEEIYKDDEPIYKYLYEIINLGIAESSNDPQLVGLFEMKGSLPKYNPNIPLIQEKYQQYLFAYLSKGVLAQKRAGDALVMVSPHGHNLIKKLVKNKVNGKIIYTWEVINRKHSMFNELSQRDLPNLVNVPYKYREGFVSEWEKQIESLSKDTEEFYFIDEVRHLVPEIKNGKIVGLFSEALMGKWDIKHDDIQDSFRYMFGVRIPSQDKQSSVNIKLVDWLPDGAGNSIVVPKEYQELSGADYDVDKIYTYKQEGYWNGNDFIRYEDNFEDWLEYTFKNNKLAKKLFKNKKQELKDKLEDINNNITSTIENILELNDIKNKDLKPYLSYIKEKIKDIENFDRFTTEEDIIKFILTGIETFETLSSSERSEIRKLQYEKRETYEKLNYVKDLLNKNRYKLKILKELKENEIRLIRNEVLKELNYPVSINDFKSSGLTNVGYLNNMTLTMFQSALVSESMLKPLDPERKNLSKAKEIYTEKGLKDLYEDKADRGIYETGTKVDPLKEADTYYSAVKRVKEAFPEMFNLENKTYSIRSAMSDFMYHIGTKAGKTGIGSSVNANLSSLVWLKMSNHSFNIKIGLDSFEVDTWKVKEKTLDNIERTFDNMSTLITATTDEAKEQALAKFGFVGKALDVASVMVSLGFRFDQIILLINSPMVQEYLQDKTPKVTVDTSQGYTYSLDELTEAIINKKGDVLEYAYLDFLSLLKVASVNRNLMKFVRLKRGFDPKVENFEDILEAGRQLGLGEIPGLETTYGLRTDSERIDSIIDFPNILIKDRDSVAQIYNAITEIIPKTKKVLESHLLVSNPNYKSLLNRLVYNSSSRDKDRLNKELQTYLISKMISRRPSSNLLIGENNLAKQILDFKQSVEDGMYGEYTNNTLLNHLMVNLATKPNLTDKVLIKTFSRLSTDKQESLIDGFFDLILDENLPDEINSILNGLVDYFGIKDGYQFKPKTISKVFPTFKFEGVSKAISKFLNSSFDSSILNDMEDTIFTDISNRRLLNKVFKDTETPLSESLSVYNYTFGNNQKYSQRFEYAPGKYINTVLQTTLENAPDYIEYFYRLYKKIGDKYVYMPYLGFEDSKLYVGDTKLNNSSELEAMFENGFIDKMIRASESEPEVQQHFIYLKSLREEVKAPESSLSVVSKVEQNIKTYTSKITSLKDNQIFVFGANPEGRNGAGAASVAKTFGLQNGKLKSEKTFGLITKDLMGYANFNKNLLKVTPFGEVYYESEGATFWKDKIDYKGIRYNKIDDGTSTTGNIPEGLIRKGSKFERNSEGGKWLHKLPANFIKVKIQELYEEAKNNPNKEYLIAYIKENKRSLNGYTSQELADMFSSFSIPSNIVFEENFSTLIKKVDTLNKDKIKQSLDKYSTVEELVNIFDSLSEDDRNKYGSYIQDKISELKEEDNDLSNGCSNPLDI